MEEYKSNSHNSKGKSGELLPEKKVEKVVLGEVKSKKKNEIQKFADLLVPEDAHSIKSYILLDVLLPAFKKIISDSVDTFLYGGLGKGKKSSPASRVSYRSYYDSDTNRRDYNSSGFRLGHNYDDIVLANRGEAEEVLSRMDELISVYGLVSVADLYDLVGVESNYTDNKYGWTDLRNGKLLRAQGGWLIKLPKALPLD